MWIEKYPHLNNNKSGSLGRLSNLLHSLTRNKQLETYDSTIREQTETSLAEKVDKDLDRYNKLLMA